MRFHEALLLIREHRHYIAIYDEAIAGLNAAADGEGGIPVDGEEAGVDQEYIDDVVDSFVAKRQYHKDEITRLEGCDVHFEDDGEE